MYVNKLILNNLMYLFSLIFILNAFLSNVINFSSYSCMAVPSNRVLRTIGTVRVYNPGPDYPWGSWPEGIKVVNEFENSESVLGDGRSKSKNYYNKNNKSNTRRTFAWKGEELQVYFEITPPTSRVSTQLAPPLTWLTNGLATRSKVKVLHNSELDINESSSGSHRSSSSISGISSVVSSSTSSSQSFSSSAVKLGIERESVEDSLSVLRMNGFKKEDIFRMFDKGPWVIAFDLSKILPRLIGDLQSHVGVTQTEAIHIISHCPYLLAQYARYKGRDVQRTIEALVEVGYSINNLVNDCMRFPSMLAAPPDRLRGWKSLLENFGVAVDPQLFGSLLKRAPFMFYLDPPFVHDMFGADFSRTSGGVTTSASSSFLFEALEVLQYIDTLNLYDMDKLIRAEPQILIESTAILQGRVEFMMALLMELWDSEQSRNEKIDTSSSSTTTSNTIDQDGLDQEVEQIQQVPGQGQGQAFVTATLGAAWEGAESSHKSSVQYEYPQQQVDTAKDWLRALLQSYPTVISLDVASIRTVCNALRSCGLRRSDVVQLIRKYPPVLRLDPDYLKLLVNFLRGRLKLPKHEIRSFLVRNSHLLKIDVKDLIRLMNYYEDLGGDLASIRDCPMYFRRSLVDFIIPRAEFLKALHFDPLFRGIDFLVRASADEIAEMAGVDTTVWKKFHQAWMERKTTSTEETGRNSDVDNESESER